MVRLTSVAALAIAATASAHALSLDQSNFDDKTAGKTVFLKMFAPWCGHCKAMAPAWEKLMEKYADHADVVVAEVDCTSDGGKPICDEAGVRGFPTIKYGSVDALEDYQGARDFDELEKFASELKPMCSPSNKEKCEPEMLKKIEELEAMTVEELEKLVAEGKAGMEKAEEDFKVGLEKLQEAYKELAEAKDETLKKIKEGGHGLTKVVLKSKKPAEEKDEAKEEL